MKSRLPWKRSWISFIRPIIYYAVSKPGQHAEMLSYIGMLQAMDFKLDIILDEVDNIL